MGWLKTCIPHHLLKRKLCEGVRKKWFSRTGCDKMTENFNLEGKNKRTKPLQHWHITVEGFGRTYLQQISCRGQNPKTTPPLIIN